MNSDVTKASPDIDPPTNDEAAGESTPGESEQARVEALLLAGIERCKTRRKELIPGWQKNVERRRGKASAADDDDTARTRVPLDWAMTKTKEAQLFSQSPKVIVTGEEVFKVAAPVFQKLLNKRIADANVAVAMGEQLPDVINAAGMGITITRFETRTAKKMMPKEDPAIGFIKSAAMKMGLVQPELVETTVITDRKATTERVSPADYLWDEENFSGSDYEQAGWLGYSGRMRWPEAMPAFNLDEGQKADYISGDQRSSLDRLSTNEPQGADDTDVVEFDEVYYRRHKYHADEAYFCTIQRVVFIKGKAVLNEPWKGQKVVEGVGVLGSHKFPVQVLTLNYISDDPIPPSDSSMGRPQVLELEQSRQDMHDQRKYAKPMNWHDINRIDPEIQIALMNGDIQYSIPVQGAGDKALGQIARSNYPTENYEFDRIIKGDIGEAYSLGPNQAGTISPGARSASEQKITQNNFATLMAKERARVVKNFLNIADVHAGFMCLYDDFALPELTQTDQQRIQGWDRTQINHKLVFTVRADSTVLLDANQRIDRIERFLNLAGKSGYVNPQPIVEELAALSELDPAIVVQGPPEKGPEPPNVSFRFSGEDLMNPGAWGLMVKAGIAPNPKELEAGKELLKSTMHLMPAGAPPPGAPEDPSAPPMTDDRPEWQAVDRINSRRDATQK